MLNVDCWMLNGCAERNVECWMWNVECWMWNVECWMWNVDCWVLIVDCWVLIVECWINSFFIEQFHIGFADHSTFHTPHSTFFYLQLCTPSVASSAVSTLTINWSTVFRVSFFFVSLMIVTVFLRVIHTCLFVLSFRFLPSAQLLEVIVFFLRQSSLKS